MTLGAAALVRVDGTTVLGPSKPLALLSYLQCAPGRTSTRDHLASLLWGDSSPEKGAGALRSTLHRLRGALNDPAPDSFGSEIALTIPLSCDRDCFLEAIRSGNLVDAVELYLGPFLPDYGASGTAEFEHWADIERARLESLFLQAALTLGGIALDQGTPKESARLARLMRARAPSSSLGWTLLLRALIAAGDDLAARAEVEALGAWLEESGRAPDPATQSLIQAIRSGAASPPDPSADQALIPELVGREREFITILGAWDAVRRGAARHIHVVAPSGLGKTRLLRDVMARLKADGASLLNLRALPGERAVPYAFAGELAKSLGSLPGALAVSPAAAAVLVDLQPALSSTFPGAHASVPEWDLLRKRSQALEELVTTVAEEHPLALIIDDLHWLDEPSASILESIAGRLGRAPLLLLTASRPRAAGASVWPEATRLALHPLTPEQIETLLASLGMFPTPDWGTRIAPAIYRSTDGVPLLVIETLQLAREAELLSLDQRVWSCRDSRALVRALGEQGSVDARLRTLEASERRLLLRLALAGSSLLESELEAPPGSRAAAGPGALEALERRGYLEREGIRWDLAHGDIGDAVVRLSTPGEQLAAHQALGTLLAARSLEPAIVRRAAHHLGQAGDQPRLNALFRRSLIEARRHDPRTSVRRHAEQFLGGSSPPEAVRALVRSVPLPARLPVRNRDIALLAAATVLVTLAVTFQPWKHASTPSDAELILASGGNGSPITLRRIPLRSSEWRAGDPIRTNQGRIVGTLPGGVVPYVALMPSPDGEHVVFDRIVNDSGQIDLYLWSQGAGLKRLTDAPGDDFGPSWSPDGRWLVFSTARWTPRDDIDADLAMLEPATGVIRHLTSGPDYDTWPTWSPDGTRIAFSRRRAGESTTRLCWITVDGGAPRCDPSTGESQTYARSWSGLDELIVWTSRPHTTEALSRLDLATWRRSGLAPAVVGSSTNPDGRWIALTRFDTAGGAHGVIPRDNPAAFRPLLPDLGVGQWRMTWSWTPMDRTYLRSLHIMPHRDTLPLGASSVLYQEGVSASGGPLKLPGSVLQWSVSDSSVARISSDAVLTPRRTGPLTVHLSAGGWRADSLSVTIASTPSVLLQRESWADTALKRWRRYGDPSPVVANGPSGTPGFLNNGDGVFSSGAWSLDAWTVSAGLAFDAIVSTPVRRTRWQRLDIMIGSRPGLVDGGLSVGDLCLLQIPIGEGKEDSEHYSGDMMGDSFRLPLPPQWEAGGWHRALIQIFPDGTCGVAMDGKPVFRSRRHLPLDQTYHLIVQGQSVGTTMLLGPFTVWRGIRDGIDWAVLDGPAGHSGTLPPPE